MRILIVDDHAYNRELLRFILEDEGHDCVDAENGQEALATFLSDVEIDLILMDVNMPVMDGITATQKIVKEKGDRYITIIFVTALDNAEVLVQCLDAGGDDFVPKPINEQVLMSKVNAHVRNQENYRKLQQAYEELTFHNQIVERDHGIVEHVFINGLDRADTYCANVKSYTSPMSMFNGDLVLSEPSPAGGQYILIGDFTGHGLSAAIGSLPVTSVFFSHVAKQTSVSEIAADINAQLNRLLPMGMFCCASLFHIDKTGTTLSYWSGGMNSALYVQEGSPILHIAADHMPLGILNPQEFDDSIQLIHLEPGGHLYVYTDGVNEAKSESEEEFGEERILEILEREKYDRINRLVDAVHDFQGGNRQKDDISLVEILCEPLVHRHKETEEIVDVAADYHSAACFPWVLQLTLTSEDLKRTDIVSQTVSFLAAIQGVELHEDKLFTITSELFNNALEHGVLRLDSNLKNTPGGFEHYYRLREARLGDLGEEQIDITLCYIRGTPNRIKLEITDSGDGFDYSKVQKKLKDNDESHGRGLHLLQSLCSELTYSNAGKTVTAFYDFI